ncbi:MAG TPA: YetF domain-containing protein [Gemmatimonadales bacterium]|jgi:uncharacterized membrane protein YcaP (DUF421 family)|nr:YetF domain-containing protein [Gemmatimonadales bacterium]
MTPSIWHDLLYPDVPILEKIIRPILVYLFLLVGLRLAGKRELATLNPLDLVVLLTISNTVQNAIIGSDNSVLGGIVGATTLLIMNYVLVDLIYRIPRLGMLIEGRPDVLISGGKLHKQRLSTERISVEDLEAAARRQGFASLKEVDQAILYPSGTFCFIGKVPRTEALHYQQLMTQLNQIAEDVKSLKPTKA